MGTLDNKIRRVGSDRCWLAPSLTRPYQKIKMRKCENINRSNDQENRQKFIEIEGRLHLEANQKLCISVDTNVVLKTCFGNNFAIDDTGVSIINSDSTIRPFEHNFTCLFYNAWVTAGAEVFLGNCADVNHQNPQRANKYKWIVENGVVKSAKDSNYCLTIDSSLGTKQRTQLHICDGSQDQNMVVDS